MEGHTRPKPEGEGRWSTLIALKRQGKNERNDRPWLSEREDGSRRSLRDGMKEEL